MKQSIAQINGEVYIDGIKIDIPKTKGGQSITQINNKLFINGYELVNGKWKRTLRALFHLIF